MGSIVPVVDGEAVAHTQERVWRWGSLWIGVIGTTWQWQVRTERADGTA